MDIGESVHSSGSGENLRPASMTIGKVKDNWNAAKPGCVKVVFKDEKGEDYESDWMHVVSPYASRGCGLYTLPDVGSTVVVGYIDDNSVSPVVLGCIWSTEGDSNSKLPKDVANSKNSVKAFCSEKGYMIRLEEGGDSDELEIVTPDKLSVKLNNKEKKVTLTADERKSTVEMNGKDGTVSIMAQKSIAFKIGSDETVVISSSGVEIKTKGKFSVDAQALEIKGNQTKINGSAIEMKADANLKIESGGIGQFKASMTKIN